MLVAQYGLRSPFVARIHIQINVDEDVNVFLNRKHLRNEFNFWNVHGIMNTSGLVQSKFRASR